MLRKLDKIPDLGAEPTQWHKLLVPILKRFVKTFDDPSGISTKDFWQRILHRHAGGSGEPNKYSGWLTAFSFWNDDGDCLYKERAGKWQSGRRPKAHSGVLTLDGATYHLIKTDDITQGWVSADVKVHEQKNEYTVRMYGGTVGMGFESSGDHGEGLDMVRPMSGWWAFEVPGAKCRKPDETLEKIHKQTQQVAIETRREMWAAMDVEC
jgi:hypothetical protein